MSSQTQPTRKPYNGSCHCGLTTYTVYLTLPPPPSALVNPPPNTERTQFIYKCNCSTCLKTGFFHVHPAYPPEDFVLWGPLAEGKDATAGQSDEEESRGGESQCGKDGRAAGFQAARGLKMGEDGLKDYTVYEKRLHWYFCSRCGVRCFLFSGLSGIVVSPDGEGREIRAWRPLSEGWSGDTGYLSVNAHTLEGLEDGLGVREWHEKGWIFYTDCKVPREDDCRWGRPWEGGTY